MRKRLSIERLGGSGARTLRFEQVEPRVLLTHMAPEVNPAVIARFPGIQENEPIGDNEPVGSNSHATVSAMLASGGIIITQQTEAPIPKGDNSEFAFFDQSYSGQEGIAVTWLGGAAEGAWQYSRNGGQSWTNIPGSVSANNALLLSGELPGTTSEDDVVRFLPNNGFSGTVALQFACWDQTDGKTPGTMVNLNNTGMGGSTAYSASLAEAVLTVAPNTPPSFSIVSTADTVLENNSGGDAGTLTAPGVVSSILPGNGGGNSVTFSASDPSGKVLDAAINSSGTLSFQLAQNAYGTVTLSVTATNGALSTTKTTQVVIEQTTPPSFNVAKGSDNVVENSGAISYPNWATVASDGMNGNSGQLSYTITYDSDTALFNSTPLISPSGTLTFTPAANTIGQATITAVLYNSETKLDSAGVTFYIGVYGTPTATAKSYVIDYVAGGSTSSASTGVLAGASDPNSAFDGGLSAQLYNGQPSYAASFSLSPNGTFSFVPNSSFPGFTRFDYVAVSGPATSTYQPVTLYSHEGAMVVNVYSEVLSRGASDADITNWAPQLHSGLGMDAFGGDIIESPEHLNQVVTAIYEVLLGRAPSQTDETNWDQQWITDGGPKNIWIDVASNPSQECFNHAQTLYNLGDTNKNWINLIFEAILSRAADPGSLTYYDGQLQSGVSMAAVVTDLVTSTEYYNDVITKYYNLYLNRAPNSTDLTNGETALKNGTELAFQKSIIVSPEYFGEPPAASGDAADLWTPA